MANKKTASNKKAKKIVKANTAPQVPQKKLKKTKSKRHHLKHHPILTFMRIIKNGFKNLWRNAWLSVAATAIMAVTLTTILLALLANKALDETITEFAKDLKLSVYLDDESTTDGQNELRNSLNSNPVVSDVKFISKEDALKDFKSDYEDQEDLLVAFEIVEDNILPASFEITVNDLDKIDELVNFVEDDRFEDVVESTSDDNKTAQLAIDQYTAQQRLIILIGIVIAAVFAVISTMVIFNTIRLAIYSRSDEVRNMKLLGASHGYIRGPFLFEASMYGVVSGLASFGFVALLLKTLVPKLISESFSAEGLSNSLNKYAIPFFDTNWEIILASTVIGGVLIGFISSALAMSRYMRY